MKKTDKVPLVIESEIFLASEESKTHKARSRILGGRHGDFILLEDPVYRVNERLSVPLEGTLVCSYFHEGDVYHFRSRIRKDLGDGLVLMEYPTRFQVEKVRKHHRIFVDIETRLYLDGAKDALGATTTDISEGGCCLVVAALLPVVRNSGCRIELILPDNKQITGLRAKIRNITFSTLKKTTQLGLQFLGPGDQLAKISSFCRFCMFFKV